MRSMGRAGSWTWWLFALTSIGVGLLIVALAVQLDADIYVEDAVLDKVAQYQMPAGGLDDTGDDIDLDDLLDE